MARRKWWMTKPFRNWMGVVPKPLRTQRTVKLELVPRVEQLVAGGAIAKPLWLDAVLAHPPPVTHKFSGERPVRFQWREDDRLRRIWQRRNPEAAMHPKVLFLDETQLPNSAVVEHPADTFVKRQQRLMRKGLSEEEAYRRVAQQDEERRRVADAEVATAQEQARSLGVTPAIGGAALPGTSGGARTAPDGDGLAARLLRRFAEEARDSGEPYPKHWFDQDGSWRGIGIDDAIGARTSRALDRQRSLAKLMDEVSLDSRTPEDDDDDDEDDVDAGVATDQPSAGASDGEAARDGR